MNKNKKAMVLILVIFVVVFLTVIGGALITRTVSESRLEQRYDRSTEAFWAAESGIYKAMADIENSVDFSAAPWSPTGGGNATLM